MTRLTGSFSSPFGGKGLWQGGALDGVAVDPSSQVSSSMGSASLYSSRMVLVTLLRKKQIVSRGNAIGTPDFIELNCPDFTWLLMHAEEITLVTLSEYHQTDLRWGMYFTSGFDRTNETTTIAGSHLLGSLLSSSGSTRHSAYTTIADFLLESRLFLGLGNANGNTGSLSATIGAALLVKTVGQ